MNKNKQVGIYSTNHYFFLQERQGCTKRDNVRINVHWIQSENVNFQVLTLDWRVLERCQRQKCARDILPKRVFWCLTSNCMQNFCNLLLLLCKSCFISRYKRHLETDSPLISRQSTFHEYHKCCVTRALFILLWS